LRGGFFVAPNCTSPPHPSPFTHQERNLGFWKNAAVGQAGFTAVICEKPVSVCVHPPREPKNALMPTSLPNVDWERKIADLEGWILGIL
jgi:hypothetical protein